MSVEEEDAMFCHLGHGIFSVRTVGAKEHCRMPETSHSTF